METGGRILLVLACAGLLLFSCASKPPQALVEPRAEPAAEAPPPPEQPAKEEFVVTEELYKKTFAQVEAAIEALTKIIDAHDYERWVSFLTSEYVRTTGSPEYLAKVSENAVLKKNGIVLRNLKDYFDNVVVLSRSQVKLDQIDFVDATHVKAFAVITGTPVILYWLVWEDGVWKIGIWQTAEE